MKVALTVGNVLMLMPLGLVMLVFAANIMGQAGLDAIEAAGLCLALGLAVSFVAARNARPTIVARVIYFLLVGVVLIVLGPVIQAAG
jgi:hypothetical protein